MIGIFVFLFVLYIIWQIHVFSKYCLGFPAIKFDSPNLRLYIGKEFVSFNDIKAIRIIPDENQPSVIEKGLSRAAAYVYLTNVEVYLNNSTMIPFRCNSKSIINTLIKNIKPPVKVIYEEKQENCNVINPLIIGFLFVLILSALVMYLSFVFN